MTDSSFQHDANICISLIDTAPDHGDRQPVRICATPGGITIFAEGYGDHGSTDGHGSPAFLELHKGNVRLVVFADINQEDPTHVIDLGGAREDRRIEIGG